MGLLDLYTNFNGGQGSAYNYDDVTSGNEPSLLGSTKYSKLHASIDGQPGYSLGNGSTFSSINGEVIDMNNAYNNGAGNLLPPVVVDSLVDLDLEGNQPSPYSNPETGATYI